MACLLSLVHHPSWCQSLSPSLPLTRLVVIPFFGLFVAFVQIGHLPSVLDLRCALSLSLSLCVPSANCVSVLSTWGFPHVIYLNVQIFGTGNSRGTLFSLYALILPVLVCVFACVLRLSLILSLEKARCAIPRHLNPLSYAFIDLDHFHVNSFDIGRQDLRFRSGILHCLRRIAHSGD